MSKYSTHLLVCGGTSCHSSESDAIVCNLRDELEAKGLTDSVQVILTGCFGFCEKGPIVKVMPDNTYYVKVKPEDAQDIVEEHVIKGKIVTRLLYRDPVSKEPVTGTKHLGLFKKQLRVVLRNCGFINPENIDEYIVREGYQALGKVLTEMTPEEVIKVVRDSGQRGRGGAGFSTGLKWELARKNQSDEKYVVCNADEGDPGAFMDRSVLEGDPHSVLEAMAICGYSIGASNGLIYIRAEYPLAIERLKIAIKQAREYGLLGCDIFGTGFNFDIKLRYGAGAFVCGEETALIHSMEGLRGEPTVKPPFPAEAGYRNKPTNVNNVETFAAIPAIILKGAKWFSSIGTEKSKGTKVFALAGKINNVGLIEVPMGTTLREVIFEIGGGIRNGKKFKGIQTGGPSGGCLSGKHLDTPIDFDNLIAVGSIMGSGAMIVLDEDDCMVSMAKFFLEFTVEESCGKCAPCRIGNKRLHELLGQICEGKGTLSDLDRLRNMSLVIKDTALCGLGQTSPNPVLSMMDNYMEEYVAHVTDKKCPAGQCRSLMEYVVNPDNCVGCTACARVCPVNAISGERKEVHLINPSICIKCGACIEKCKFDAIFIR
jgi:NADH:ubiquinone oxidoreductase subunit F (NADH-binding)/(2Fe-2S) ferredoxin